MTLGTGKDMKRKRQAGPGQPHKSSQGGKRDLDTEAEVKGTLISDNGYWVFVFLSIKSRSKISPAAG